MAKAIYVHIPYCLKKCPYCDFASIADKNPPLDAYVSAVIREMRLRLKEGSGPVSSVYFGGGTPSLLSARHIDKILGSVKKCFGVAEDAEITVEANPETVSKEKLSEFYDAGINRISLGVQSFQAKALKALGRSTTAKRVGKSVEEAMSSPVANVSLDMIFGLWSRSEKSVRKDIDLFIKSRAPHISAYCLTIYDETPLGRKVKEGLCEYPEEDKAAAEYDLICDALKKAGYEQYEISNFAFPGMHSRHNANYWLRKAYIGLGASAASFIEKAAGAPYGVRFRNEPDPDRYIKAVAAGDLPIKDMESVTGDEALAESIFLGMRMLRGISISAIERRFGINFRSRYSKPLDLLIGLELIELIRDRLKLTRKGLFLSDEVFSYFV